MNTVPKITTQEKHDSYNLLWINDIIDIVTQ